MKANPDISLQAMSLNGILDSLALTSAVKMVLIDASWNGSAGASLRGGPLGPAPLDPPPGTILSFASEPGAIAPDGGGATSAFSDALARRDRKAGRGDQCRCWARSASAIASMTGGRQASLNCERPCGRRVLRPGGAAAAAPPCRPAAGTNGSATVEELPSPSPPPLGSRRRLRRRLGSGSSSSETEVGAALPRTFPMEVYPGKSTTTIRIRSCGTGVPATLPAKGQAPPRRKRFEPSRCTPRSAACGRHAR